jgi:hypothetical protein
MTPPSQPPRSIWSHLPSFVWILIFVGGIVALIGTIIALFYALSHIEGFASVLMLVVAWFVMRAGSSVSDGMDTGGAGFIRAIGIGFFALMGMAIDQPGNYVYNRPIQWFFCPSNTVLQRGVDVTHPLPGRTDITQDFMCVDTGKNEVSSRPGMGEVIAVRFGEYVLIGYLLIGLNRLYMRLRARPAPAG